MLLLGLSATAACGGDCLARIEAQCIPQQDVQYRQQIGDAYGRHSKAATILVALINDAIDEAIAQRLHLAPTAAEVQGLATHADNTSRNPELLNQIKALFVDDPDSYRRLYLRPKVTSDKLHSYHSRHRNLHTNATERIEAAYALVSTGTALPEAAERLQLEYHESTPRQEPAEFPSAMRQYGFEVQDMPPDPIEGLLADVQPGGLYPQIVETDHAFLVVRLISRDESGVRYETIAAAKRPYETWLQDMGSEVSITILDPALHAEVRTRYAQIWWVRDRLQARTGDADGSGVCCSE